MALTTYGGKLLQVGRQLALSAYCCCVRWCRETGKDECGNPVYGCVNEQAGSIGQCTPDCKPPEEPCECGPDKPCGVCFECIDRKCVRIEDCCLDGSPCPECSACVDGACVPCGECEQCIDGICLPCGPCQKCEDGACRECAADEVCINGECVPKKYYCCWASAEDKRLNTNNTTCKAATVSGGTQTSPCGTGTDEYDGYAEVDLTKSGPYASLQQCEPNCQKYRCATDACGNRECVPDANGPYPTRAACLAACGDPCSTPCTFQGGNSPGEYAIDGCERDICVSYVSTNSRPIRVQIWGRIMQDGCEAPNTRVIKADSGWRGDACCDCPDLRGEGQLDGGPKGQVTWNKPRGTTWFEVAVLAAGCSEGYELDIRCDGECVQHPDPDPCPCTGDENCADGCHCCGGACREEPCDECDTDEDCPCWGVDTYPQWPSGNPDCGLIAETSGDQFLFCGPDSWDEANAEATRRYGDPQYAGCDHTVNPAGNGHCCGGECQYEECPECCFLMVTTSGPLDLVGVEEQGIITPENPMPHDAGAAYEIFRLGDADAESQMYVFYRRFTSGGRCFQNSGIEGSPVGRRANNELVFFGVSTPSPGQLCDGQCFPQGIPCNPLP